MDSLSTQTELSHALELISKQENAIQALSELTVDLTGLLSQYMDITEYERKLKEIETSE